MRSLKILLVATSHDSLGDTGKKTGLWLEELAAPYYIFKDAGERLTIASPNGGQVPVDPESEAAGMIAEAGKRFRKDVEATYQLSHSLPLQEVKANDFDMVFLPGGHGPMWDLPGNSLLKKLLEEFNRQHKLMGFVCHGAAALVPLQKDNGEPVVRGKRLTAFSDNEEKLTGLADEVPFLLESRLLSLGAAYSKGPDFTSYVVTDENIVTGQNPASSAAVAEKLLMLAHNSMQAEAGY